MRIENTVRPMKTRLTKTTTTRTRTEPSPTRLRATADSDSISISSSILGKETSAEETPILVDEDLFALPSDLHAVYRRGPRILRILLSGIIGNIVLMRDSSLQSQAIRKGFYLLFAQGPLYAISTLMLQLQQASWGSTGRWLRWLVGFIVRYMILTTLPILILQERFGQPSRISANDLEKQYFLPSTLSRFENVPVQVNNVSTTTGLHWLEYRNDTTVAESVTPRKILHCQHGFGASSLSWLPCLKPLTDKLGCQVGLAHDRLGFGFSEPPQEDGITSPLYWYTFAGSSRVAASLLETQSLKQNDSLVLVGHSMGCLSTLRLALELPRDLTKKIILVAPALGLLKLRKYHETDMKKLALGPSIFGTGPRFMLRRLVGIPGFWRTGLKKVWGDASRLKDSDVLRFQWPAVHKGWEAGLLRFARSSTLSIAGYDEIGPLSDKELLRRVLALPNTTVEVILGEKDLILPSKSIRKFLEPFPSLRIQELPGLGHDPFEEDVDAFLRVID